MQCINCAQVYRPVSCSLMWFIILLSSYLFFLSLSDRLFTAHLATCYFLFLQFTLFKNLFFQNKNQDSGLNFIDFSIYIELIKLESLKTITLSAGCDQIIYLVFKQHLRWYTQLSLADMWSYKTPYFFFSTNNCMYSNNFYHPIRQKYDFFLFFSKRELLINHTNNYKN
jgi:hypothetical protein